MEGLERIWLKQEIHILQVGSSTLPSTTKIFIIEIIQAIFPLSLTTNQELKRLLNRSVHRNIKRFPDDFMFQLNESEFESLKCQFGTSKSTRGGKQKLPLVFTENGVAMLSSVLRSDRAIEVNISIMRIFTKLRSFLLFEKNIDDRVTHLEQGTKKLFKIVFERLDHLESETPLLPKKLRKIGLT